MNEFNAAAKEVSGFYKRNRIQRIDIVSAVKEEDGEASLHVKWKKAGREHGEILILSDSGIAHMALAILKGQSAEPILQFGEKDVRPAERGPDYYSVRGITAEL